MHESPRLTDDQQIMIAKVGRRVSAGCLLALILLAISGVLGVAFVVALIRYLWIAG